MDEDIWWSPSPSEEITVSESDSISVSSSISASPSASSELVEVHDLIEIAKDCIRKSEIITVGLWDRVGRISNEVEDVAYSI